MPILLALLVNFAPAHAGPTGCGAALSARAARVIVATLALGFLGAGENESAVDLQLVLLTDVSGSIGQPKYELQREGIARALEAPAVPSAIARCAPRGVALAYTEWGESMQVSIPFRRVADAGSLGTFARLVRGHDRARSYDLTDVETALRGAHRLLQTSPWIAGRRVIDISSDGVQNVDHTGLAIPNYATWHARVGRVRDEIVDDDITINALTIDLGQPKDDTGDQDSLEAYYRAHVIGGVQAFTENISTFGDVQRGLEAKLSREICVGTNF